MFRNISIGRKMIVAFGSIVVVVMVFSVFVFNALSEIELANRENRLTASVLATTSQLLSQLVEKQNAMRGFTASLDEEFIGKMDKAAANSGKLVTQLSEMLKGTGHESVVSDLRGAIAKFDNEAAAIVASVRQPEKLADTRKQIASVARLSSIREILTEYENHQKAEAELRDAALASAFSVGRLTLILGGLIAALGALLMGMMLSKSIGSPIVAMTAIMGRLARGEVDLVVPEKGRKDEIGAIAAAVEVFRANAIANVTLTGEAENQRHLAEQERRRIAEVDRQRAEAMAQATSGLGRGLHRLASGDLTFRLSDAFDPAFENLRADFNASVDQLANALMSVAHSANAIDGGAGEVSSSAASLSARTERQAASLEETAAALDEITTNVSNASKRAEEARVVAIEANKSAAESGKVVANAVDAMGKIEASSQQISNIIGVIDEIAFQTNLLALNAGVEAARAGEAGRGFAVVAQEVRELAQRSAKAAKEIKGLIGNSSAEVEGGVKLVRMTGEVLKTIEQHVVSINQHMDAIATSAREQSVGLAEVNTAVNQMDQVTQQNAAMVEETTAASATLASEAGRLRDLIGKFELSQPDRPMSTGRVSKPAAVSDDQPHQAIPSPARQRVAKVANAFGQAAAKDSWEEF